MFACALILIFLLPVALARLVLKGSFSANELDEMGIRIEPPLGCSRAGDSLQTV